MTLPPCGHGNGTHPSDCWWPAAMEMAAEARAPLEEEIAALRAALDGLVKAAEGSLVASGGHMDSDWNDVIGATQSWHDCLPNASALRAALAKAKGTP